MALYHSARGSVGYALYGNPTIVDGVLTGGTTSNYVYTTTSLPLSTLTSLEIVVKATHPSGTSGFRIASFSGTNYSFLEVSSNGKVSYYGNPTCYRTDLSIDDYSYVKLTLQGATSQPHIYFSSNKISWTESALTALTDTERTITDSPVNFGRSSSANSGSIDLNETYIKVNGQAWFGICPIEVEKHQLMGPVGYTVVGSPTISNGVVSGFSASDYLKTQTLPISTLSSLVSKVKFTTGTLGTTQMIGGCQYSHGSFGFEQKSNNKLLFRISYYNASSQTNYLETTVDYALSASTTYYAEAVYNNLQLTLKLYNSQNELLGSASGNIPANNTGLAPSGNMFYGYNSQHGTFTGSIDLKETYIKVNGKLWFWQPAPTKYIVKDGKLVWGAQDLYLNDGGTITQATQDLVPVPSGFTYGSTTTTDVGLVDIHTQVFTAHPGATIGQGEPPSPTPSNYTVVGSPTISGNSVSSFSASNYLTLDSVPTGPISSLEFTFNMIHANTYYRTGAYSTLFQSANNVGHAPYCNFSGNGMFKFAVYLNDHTEVSIQQSFLDAGYIKNKDLGFKFVYDSSLSSNQAKLYWNTTGSWILLNQKNMASLCWDEPLNIGTATAGSLSNYFLGSIDLSQWSITVNGQAWWPFTPWS